MIPWYEAPIRVDGYWVSNGENGDSGNYLLPRRIMWLSSEQQRRDIQELWKLVNK